VSDLTYVRVGNKWNYICILLDLHAREIIGASCGERKTPSLVLDAFTKADGNLSNIKYFHTDRGSEFKNYSIDEML
ncbi:DDE-type integrase/transposase/recombinase, partial [Erysipelothrix rhusiopathiae]|nr:DDE-type integrase/transposase/recombinase [Erysipelothrix rhusiopathiae]